MAAQDQIDVVTGAFSGGYRIRAIHVEDLAKVCADGPQSLPFRKLATVIRDAVGSHAAIVPVPGVLLLTRDEYLAMAAGLADSDAPATGHIAFTDWLAEHGQELRRTHANEINLHFRPSLAGEPAH
jgi:hypothetical protein